MSAGRSIVVIIFAALLIGGFVAVRRYLPAVRAPFGSPAGDITKFLPDDSLPPEAINETNLSLKLPAGFRISIFAKNLPGARVMRRDSFGNFWVSRTSQGAVTLLELDRDSGRVSHQEDVFRGLNRPHGLAFDTAPGRQLYIAEEDRLWRVATYSDDKGETVLELPTAGGGHFTRTIGFGPASAPPTARVPADAQALAGRSAGKPDDKQFLYISIGSSCNVCREEDERRAAILRVDPAAKKSEIFARGLRNSVFFTWNPVDGSMWATDMGRDWLGDDLPPDEINVIEEGVNFGWPNCYGKNVHDDGFDKNVYIRDPCTEPFERASVIDIPAHSAPLGLAFIPPTPGGSGQAADGWPEDYWYDLLVAYHGSWNRSQPTGYKVVRHKFDAGGNYEGVEDFITGWLTPEGALGRPVDILVEPGGVAYISDDKAGVIYKVNGIAPSR